MIKVTVHGVQQAQNAIRKELEKLISDKTVLVGIHEDAGNVKGEDFTMAELGATLHFGAEINHPGGTSYGYKTEKDMINGKVSFLKNGEGHAVIGVTAPHKIKIPPRPWLDVGVASGTNDYIEAIKNSNGDIDNALEKVGQIAVGKVQQYMTDLQDPPNAQSTIDKKGSSNPLIADGTLRASVTYSVDTVKPKEGL